MKLKLKNKIQLALISLVVFSLLVGISAISASEIDNNTANDTGVILKNGTLYHYDNSSKKITKLATGIEKIY